VIAGETRELDVAADFTHEMVDGTYYYAVRYYVRRSNYVGSDDFDFGELG
jgi:hypothetical protein